MECNCSGGKDLGRTHLVMFYRHSGRLDVNGSGNVGGERVRVGGGGRTRDSTGMNVGNENAPRWAGYKHAALLQQFADWGSRN